MTMNLSNEEVTDLLTVLNVALLDASDESQRQAARNWIYRFSQQIGGEGKPRVGFYAPDVDEQAHQDWSNEE